MQKQPVLQDTTTKALAQYNLGQSYYQGVHGLTQSSKRAIEYYTLAAEQGYIDAQYNLGHMYVRGDGIEQSRCYNGRVRRIGRTNSRLHGHGTPRLRSLGCSYLSL